jgi:hypothetical protein
MEILPEKCSLQFCGSQGENLQERREKRNSEKKSLPASFKLLPVSAVKPLESSGPGPPTARAVFRLFQLFRLFQPLPLIPSVLAGYGTRRWQQDRETKDAASQEYKRKILLGISVPLILMSEIH